MAGAKVYLEPKKSTYHGKEKYHMLKEGEDLYLVSNKYGVKLDALAKRNGLEKNEVPLPRQKIMLKGKPKTELKTADPYQVPGSKKKGSTKPIPTGEGISIPTPSDQITASTGNAHPVVSKPSSMNDIPAVVHTVMKGDTLYGIARTYGLSVDELKKKNNLAVDTIYVGQKLVWK
jgi:LysM repeat protein